MQRRMLLAVLVFLAAGCAASGPPLVPVSGQVWLDKKPLALKTIRFVPEPGTPGVGAGATTDGDGKYTLIAVRPGATKDVLGVVPGAYRVVVTEPILPIETATAPGADGPAPAIGPPDLRRKRMVIPPQYTKEETTPLRVQVPEQGGVLDLTLRP